MSKVVIGIAIVAVAGILICCVKAGADADRQMEKMFNRRK